MRSISKNTGPTKIRYFKIKKLKANISLSIKTTNIFNFFF